MSFALARKTNALPSSLLLAFIVLSFGGYCDYANGQELDVYTDKQIYNLGDTVVIFGTVPDVLINNLVQTDLLIFLPTFIEQLDLNPCKPTSKYCVEI